MAIPNPKAEALEALGHALHELVNGQAPLEGHRRVQLRAALEYAQDCVEMIQELKRPRKARKETV